MRSQFVTARFKVRQPAFAYGTYGIASQAVRQGRDSVCSVYGIGRDSKPEAAHSPSHRGGSSTSLEPLAGTDPDG